MKRKLLHFLKVQRKNKRILTERNDSALKDFEAIKSLIGQNITEEALKNIDCYVRPQLSILIPASELNISDCKYTHPSYIVKIYFEHKAVKQVHYLVEITSPDTVYSAEGENHFYQHL